MGNSGYVWTSIPRSNDHPQRIADVAHMFERHGAHVTFAGFEPVGDGMTASVVRGIKQPQRRRRGETMSRQCVGQSGARAARFVYDYKLVT